MSERLPEEANHSGHRARLRERYRREGLEGFAPHEVLELLLTYGRARGDVNPAAHALLDTFGSLKGVLEADPRELQRVKGVGEESAVLISLCVPLFRRYSACLTEEKKAIRTTAEAEAYCLALLQGHTRERFCAVSLGSRGNILATRVIAEGTLDEVPAYPRLVVEAALQHNAPSILLCHNHPSGSCEPSPADLQLTLSLKRTLKELGIGLLDHIIATDGQTWSMAAHGQLDEPVTPVLPRKRKKRDP